MLNPQTIREVETFLSIHDQFMAQPPVHYRGYEITPVSHKAQPYFIRGRFVYWGYIIVANGLNMGPGAVWFHTVQEAERAIDCIYIAGGHGRHWKDNNWVPTFWELLHDKLAT